jgi:hypothetical protein
MSALQTIWNYAINSLSSSPRTIIGVSNNYYYPKSFLDWASKYKNNQFNSPLATERFIAKKGWLTGTWSVYEEIKRKYSKSVESIKIAANLDGKEAFDLVRNDEKSPPLWKFAGSMGYGPNANGEEMPLKQEQPDTPTYWRNLRFD